MNDILEIWCDGACSKNPGPGGWACVLVYGKQQKEISGGNIKTTNNRMELQALVEGLSLLKSPTRVRVFADSEYVLNPITKGWLKGWIKKDWKSSSGAPVKNQDLWQKLLPLLSMHQIEFNKVKGHAGVTLNERVDTLAVQARRDVVKAYNMD